MVLIAVAHLAQAEEAAAPAPSPGQAAVAARLDEKVMDLAPTFAPAGGDNTKVKNVYCLDPKQTCAMP